MGLALKTWEVMERITTLGNTSALLELSKCSRKGWTLL